MRDRCHTHIVGFQVPVCDCCGEEADQLFCVTAEDAMVCGRCAEEDALCPHGRGKTELCEWCEP